MAQLPWKCGEQRRHLRENARLQGRDRQVLVRLDRRHPDPAADGRRQALRPLRQDRQGHRPEDRHGHRDLRHPRRLQPVLHEPHRLRRRQVLHPARREYVRREGPRGRPRNGPAPTSASPPPTRIRAAPPRPSTPAGASRKPAASTGSAPTQRTITSSSAPTTARAAPPSTAPRSTASMRRPAPSSTPRRTSSATSAPPS